MKAVVVKKNEIVILGPILSTAFLFHRYLPIIEVTVSTYTNPYYKNYNNSKESICVLKSEDANLAIRINPRLLLTVLEFRNSLLHSSISWTNYDAL